MEDIPATGHSYQDAYPATVHAPIREALDHFERHIQRGTRIIRGPSDGQFIEFVDCYFVPFNVVDHYFASVDRVAEILHILFGPNIEPPVQAYAVRKHYLKVFCILLEINRAWSIEAFTSRTEFHDRHLDVLSPERAVPLISPADRDAFHTKKWKYCAHHFDLGEGLDQRLDSLLVLPITSKKILKINNGVMITKIDIHGDYDHLGSRKAAGEQKHAYVLKSSIKGPFERELCHRTEVKTFAMIRDSIDVYPEAIVQFFGSFQQDQVSNIILEYADEDCLESYFKRTHPPTTIEEHVNFWKAMRDLVAGLLRLHSIAKSYQGYHQDLKPQNVLVFSGGADSPFRFRFKIADFGTSQLLPADPSQRSVSGPGKHGVKTYGSPESAQNFKYAGKKMMGSQASDVWSMACIFSVAATWVVGGWNLVKKYADERSNARVERELSLTDCFHDDTRVLLKVEQWHWELVRYSRKLSDDITPRIWKQVIKPALHEDTMIRCSNTQFHNNMIELLDKRAGWISHSSGGTSAPSEISPSMWDSLVEKERRLYSLHNDSRLDSIYAISMSESSQHEASTTVLPPPNRMLTSTSRFHADPESMEENIRNDSAQTSPEQGPGHWSRHRSTLSGGSSTHRGHYPRHGRFDPSLDIIDQDTGSESFKRQSVHHQGTDTSHLVSSWATLSNRHDGLPRSPGLAPIPASSPADTQVENMRTSQVRNYDATQQHQHSADCPHSDRNQSDGLSYMSVEELLNYPKPSLFAKLNPEIETEKNKVRRRELVFLIDDAKSMRKTHWIEVVNLFTGLANFLEDCDENGMELRFTVSSERNNKGKASKLIATVKSIESRVLLVSDPTTQFSQIFQKYKEGLKQGKRKKLGFGTASHKPGTPLSIIFLTDGIWSRGADLTDTIKSMVKYLFEEPPTMGHGHIGIQMIRFGNDEQGVSKLEYYDNLHLKGIVNKDIVDTVPSNGNVWKMILGPTQKGYDEQGEKKECNCGAFSR